MTFSRMTYWVQQGESSREWVVRGPGAPSHSYASHNIAQNVVDKLNQQRARAKRAINQRDVAKAVGPGRAPTRGVDTPRPAAGTVVTRQATSKPKRRVRRRSGNPKQLRFPFVGKECYAVGDFKVCNDAHGTFRITFTSRAPGSEGEEAELYANKENNRSGGCRFRTGSVFVPDKLLGERIGTKLYEAGMRAAQRAGCKYGSSSNRSVFSESFWKKQLRKGRATCVRTGGPAEYYSPPYDDISYKCERGRLPKKLCDRLLDAEMPEDHDGYGGSWPCNHYLLKTPMPTSLGKLKKRGKR